MFDTLFSTFSDSTVYFVMGAVGSALFLLRLGVMLVFGADGADFDVDGDGGVESHAGDFSLFSMLSIMSFMMGAGWLGLACRMEWGFGPLPSAIFASAFGFSLMLLSSVGMYQMGKLNQVNKFELSDFVGQIGRVYLKIPAAGQGRGQVQVAAGDRQRVLPAISTGEEIESFADIKVVQVQGTDTLVVERANASSNPGTDTTEAPAGPVPETPTR